MRYLIPFLLRNEGICRPISPILPEGVNKVLCNISVTGNGSDIIYNIRCTDYMYLVLNKSYSLMYTELPDHGQVISTNVTGVIHTHTLQPAINVYNDAPHFDFMFWNRYAGIEDMRLACWDGDLYGIGFTGNIIRDKLIPVIIKFNPDLTFGKAIYLDNGVPVEKNWQPVQDMPFTFIYDPGSAVGDTASVITIDPNNIDMNGMIKIHTKPFTNILSGSSQLIPIGDMYLSICHRRTASNDPDTLHIVYNHYFVIYDRHFNIKQISKPFQFMEPTLEFCCGMYADNTNLYISFNICDISTHIVSIPIDKFTELLPTLMGEWDSDRAPEYYKDTLQYVHGYDALLYNNLISDIGHEERYEILRSSLPGVANPTTRNQILLHTYLRQHIPDPRILDMICK